MNLTTIAVMLADAGQTATQEDPRARMVQTLGMFLIMGVMFYFMLIRPQSKKAKEHAALLKLIKSGDRVTTSSGIVGTVVTVKDRTVSLRSADSKLEVLKSAIAEITKESADAGTAES